MSTPNSCWDPVLRWSAVRKWGSRVGCGCEGGGLLHGINALTTVARELTSSLGPLAGENMRRGWQYATCKGSHQNLTLPTLESWTSRLQSYRNNNCLLFISQPVYYFVIEAQTKISVSLFIFIFPSICLIISNRTCSLTLVGTCACITEMHAF